MQRKVSEKFNRTGLAAVQEGYTATSIEVTDTYAELARERIRKELACAA